MNESLRGKTAVVTGASTGIGRAIALQLANGGAFVYLLARREDRLKDTLSAVLQHGGTGKVIVVDLANVKSINKALRTIVRKADRIDLIANVAGVWHGTDEVYAGIDFEKFDQKVILETYRVGIMAPTLLVHGLLPLMPEGSSIINISGTFENGAKGWLPYYVSKKAIEELTIGLSQELAEKKIRVNCISPSDTSTDEYAKYFPEYLDESVTPEEVAAAVIDLAFESGKSGSIKVVKKKY